MVRTQTWKHAEREVAKLLGGERVPVTGRGRGSAPDIAHDWLSPEIKHRKELPGWIKDAMAQAVASQLGDQLPIVVLHEHGQRYTESLVMIRLADFITWFGTMEGLTDDGTD